MILAYHNIAEEKGFYTLELKQLEEQMHYLKDHYQIISVDEYVNYIIKHGKSPEDTAVVTFDDAYVSYATLAVPLFDRLQIPSAVFVCTGVLGKSNEWNEEQYRFPVMDVDTLVELSRNKLITIGAHTVGHPVLSELQRAIALFELSESKSFLEKLLGRQVQYLAYPYGQLHMHVNQMIINMARDLEYKAAFTTNHDMSSSKNMLHRLNRVDIKPEDDLDQFILKLQPNNPFYQEQKKQNLLRLVKNPSASID